MNRIFLLLLTFFLLACSLFTAPAARDRTPIAGKYDPGPVCPTVTCNCQAGPTPTPTPAPTSTARPARGDLGTNVALEKPVVSREGGISYPDWGGANDEKDYGTTTLAEKGRWGNQTNAGGGTYEIVDLGRVYTLTGVGYTLDWDGAFANALTFQVLVSTDAEAWTLVASTVHAYSGDHIGNHVEANLAIDPVRARYVKYWEPPDGAWNGWGNFFQLRAFAKE